MKQPKTAQVYSDKQEYWNKVESLRTNDGLPSWAFDFISVHAEPIPPRHVKVQGYSFCAPMCVVESVLGGKRPDWESDCYADKKSAVNAARKFAAMYSNLLCGKPIHVVVC